MRRRDRTATTCPPGFDSGSASVLLLTVGLLLVLAGFAGATVGAAHVARHQARTAADLGALAGAMRAIEGPRSACARAAAVAAANGARLTHCAVDGLEVTVTAEVPAPPVTGPNKVATASARAGPLSGPGDAVRNGSSGSLGPVGR